MALKLKLECRKPLPLNDDGYQLDPYPAGQEAVGIHVDGKNPPPPRADVLAGLQRGCHNWRGLS